MRMRMESTWLSTAWDASWTPTTSLTTLSRKLSWATILDRVSTLWRRASRTLATLLRIKSCKAPSLRIRVRDSWLTRWAWSVLGQNELRMLQAILWRIEASQEERNQKRTSIRVKRIRRRNPSILLAYSFQNTGYTWFHSTTFTCFVIWPAIARSSTSYANIVKSTSTSRSSGSSIVP